MRRALLVSVVCASTLVAPAPAVSQLQQPLRTFCMTAAQDFCLSVLNWSYVDGSPTSAGSLAFDFDVFGSAVPVGPLTLAIYVTGNPANGDYIDQVERTGPGMATFGDGTSASLGPGGQDPNTVDFFVANLSLYGNDFRSCSTSAPAGGARCYEVPEPGTLPLLLLSALGLGIVALRRRVGCLDARLPLG